jgi:hypothetical protein
MGRIEQLADRFEEFIRVPWHRTISGGQRVVLVVYDKDLERRLKSGRAEFEQRTRAAGYGWIQHDCTAAFAEWMASMEYRDAYFEDPEVLDLKLEAEFLDHVAGPLRKVLRRADDKTVVALTGTGALYGFTRVSELIRMVEPDIKGRLAVFFPGSSGNHTVSLLDARDGWNYLATIISLHGTGFRL